MFIIGVIVSYYFYKRQQSNPVYQTKTIKIIDNFNDNKLEDIKIIYKNKNVQRVLRSYITFWNCGDKTIYGKDIVEKDKLRIVFSDCSKDGEIIYSKIVKKNRDVNDFTIMPEKDNEIIINFDFIDCNDGVVIEVVHSFTESSISLQGTIRGISKDINYYGSIEDSYFYSKKAIIEEIFLFSFISILIFSIFYGSNLNTLKLWNPAAALILFLILILAVRYIYMYLILKRLPPKNLRF